MACLLVIDASRRGHPLIAVGTELGGCLSCLEVQGDASELATVAGLQLASADGDVVGIAAVRGPGSFMGVRAGLATALGLAQGRGLPLLSLGRLEALAYQTDGTCTEMVVLADAGRGGIYAQRLERTGQPGAPRWSGEDSLLLERETPGPRGWEGLPAFLDTPPPAWRGLEGRSRLAAERSLAEALCLAASAARRSPTRYDQIRADYGTRVGAGQ